MCEEVVKALNTGINLDGAKINFGYLVGAKFRVLDRVSAFRAEDVSAAVKGAQARNQNLRLLTRMQP